MRLHFIYNNLLYGNQWPNFLRYGEEANLFKVESLTRDITDLVFHDEVEEFLCDLFNLNYHLLYEIEYVYAAMPVLNNYLDSLFVADSYYSDSIRIAKFDHNTNSVLLSNNIWNIKFLNLDEEDEDRGHYFKKLEYTTEYIFTFLVREMARMCEYRTKNKPYYYHLTGADRQKAQWLEETIVRGVQRLFAEQFMDSKYTLMHIDMLNTGGLFKSEGFISADMLYQASSDCGLKIKDKTYEELLRTIICHSRDRYEDSYDYVRMLGRLSEIGPKKVTNNGRLKWKI